jgi:hypothetical protein
MKHIPLQLAILATLAAGAVAGQTYALEAATTGSQATQATVGAINSKVDTSIAALQAQIGGMTYCNSIRKFYAPTDPKKDANGCVGTGDYDLNMASGNNVNFTNGRVYATQNASSNWGGLFYGPSNYGGVYGQAGIYGVYGYATGNGYGVIGNATATSGGVGVRGDGATGGWAGYFVNSSSTGSGVLSYLNGGAYSGYWTGEFYGGYGVYIGNSSNNMLLCLNGKCSRRGFGGTYTWNNQGYCYRNNPETGNCSCPGGFSAVYGTGGFNHLDLYICE